jgi:hypothetical protein
MEFRSTIVWLVAVCFLLGEARFYRNIPLVRNRARELQVEEIIPTAEVEIFEEADHLKPLENSNPVALEKNMGSHLIALRPDYAFMNIANMFRNFFDKRLASVSERKRRNGKDLGVVVNYGGF